MSRAVWIAAVVIAAYKLGHWSGEADGRQSVTIATCPLVEARWIGTGRRRRLDTLTYIPEGCR